MTLSPRQEQAAAINYELPPDAAWILNPMPLSRDAQHLRIQVLNTHRDAVLELLSNMGWSAMPESTLARISPGGLREATIYKVHIPADRIPVNEGDRSVPRLFERRDENKQDETSKVLKHLGLRP